MHPDTSVRNPALQGGGNENIRTGRNGFFEQTAAGTSALLCAQARQCVFQHSVARSKRQVPTDLDIRASKAEPMGPPSTSETKHTPTIQFSCLCMRMQMLACDSVTVHLIPLNNGAEKNRERKNTVADNGLPT